MICSAFYKAKPSVMNSDLSELNRFSGMFCGKLHKNNLWNEINKIKMNQIENSTKTKYLFKILAII